MARCGCSGTCACSLAAGDGITISGNGSAANPYTISAAGGVTCDDVRPCLSAGDGVAYNPATGVISARISADPGNAAIIGGDGGIYAAGGGGGGGLVAVAHQDTPCVALSGLGTAPQPLEAALVVDPASGNLIACGPNGAQVVLATGCGLLGDGTPGDPLRAAAYAWPYACDLDTAGGGVYCDSAGGLRSDPLGTIRYFTTSVNEAVANLAVPATTTTGGTTIATRSLNITNPSDCYPALAITSVEVDVDFVLPPGGRAGHFVYGDEMYRFENEGNATVSDVHTQTTKVLGNTLLAPGAGTTVQLEIGLGFGQGGATYNRVQSFIRAVVIAFGNVTP